MAMNMDAMLRIKADVQGENNIRRLGNSMQGLQGQVKNVSMSVAGLGAAFRGLGAALAVGGFAAAIKNVIDMADDMHDLSQRTGVTVETLGRFKVVAEMSGTSLEGVAKGLKFLNKNMVEAASGSKEATAAFATIGVGIKDTDGKLRSADQVFLSIADKFSKMRDGPEKAALAMRVLGKAGTDLIPVLNLGSAEIEKFGIGIGSNFSNQADAFNDRLALMKAQTTVLTVQIGSALMPVLNLLLDAVMKAARLFSDLFGEIYKVIGGMAGMQKIAAELTKVLVVLGTTTAAVFVVSNISTFAGALGKVLVAMRALLSVEKGLLALETARASIMGVIAGLSTPGPAQAKALAAVAGAGVGLALVAGVGKLIDDLTKKIGAGLNDLTKTPNLPTTLTQGTIPDLSGLNTSAGKKEKDNSKKIAEDLRNSREALLQSRAELGILRELDPLKKIDLEYQEKRRALIAAAAKEQSEATSVEQQANIQRKRSVDLQKLDVERVNDLTDAYKKLKGAGFDAASGGEVFSQSIDKGKSALEGFRDGVSSYLESIGTLKDNISNFTQGTIKGLEDAIVSLTTTGTFNFRQFALSIVEEVTRMVTRLLIIAPILQAIQSLIPGAGGGLFGGIGGLSKTVGFGAGTGTGFASGGVINQPTFFKFADGGAGRLGLMGEAGPEAIIPLRRGRDGKLGVAGGNGTSVVVNVDAKGSNVQGDDARSNALGRAVSQAVQAELIKQRRPGGLLAA